MDKKELWLRLSHYNFDHIVPPNLWDHISRKFSGADSFCKAFASKIARKHGWDPKFALRAVGEYKKFVYLGVVSNFHVTPSKIIDVVWHEHLLFSKAYRQFCQEIIQSEFDHYPELIPLADQTSRFHVQYHDTLKMYKKEFDTFPPADIWDIPKYANDNISAPDALLVKKNNSTDTVATSYSTDGALHTYFDTSGHNSLEGYGGGDFGGAGAAGAWSQGGSVDSGSTDSGSDGSGCSSGCGGGD